MRVRSLQRRLLGSLIASLAWSVLGGEDPVLEWNLLMLQAIRAETTPPTLASRNLAILHTAIHDAVNSVERINQPYRFQLAAPDEVSSEAAAVGAAHVVSVVLYSSLRASFDETYGRYLDTSEDSASRSNGLKLGRLIGALTVDSRVGDGASTEIPYVPVSEPGHWRRTPPHYRPPLDPHWGLVEPFCLHDLEPVMPPGPPPLTSAEYAAQLRTVQEWGGAQSSLRSVEQTVIAQFWSDFSYTATPAGHWQEIAGAIARTRGGSLAEHARWFALLSLAQADTAIVTWEAKYRYHFWRPVTAIQTTVDPGWQPLLVSPPFPEYPSGHSAFSGTSATVLTSCLGTDQIAFSIGADALPGVTRAFTRLSECAEEVGMSRIYGGIHYMSANVDGKTTGSLIGKYVVDHFLLPHDRLPMLLVDGFRDGALHLRLHGRIGRVARLEGSGDLARWEVVHTGPFVAGGIRIQCPAPGDLSARFYRLAEE